MTHSEMKTLFEKMKELVCMTEKQRLYDARQWKECVNLWLSVFAPDEFRNVWAGVRMYINRGGKYWPYPGEIADLMPACPYLENDELRNLTFKTRAAAKIEAARLEKQHRLNPWSC